MSSTSCIAQGLRRRHWFRRSRVRVLRLPSIFFLRQKSKSHQPALPPPPPPNPILYLSLSTSPPPGFTAASSGRCKSLTIVLATPHTDRPRPYPPPASHSTPPPAKYDAPTGCWLQSPPSPGSALGSCSHSITRRRSQPEVGIEPCSPALQSGTLPPSYPAGSLIPARNFPLYLTTSISDQKAQGWTRTHNLREATPEVGYSNHCTTNLVYHRHRGTVSGTSLHTHCVGKRACGSACWLIHLRGFPERCPRWPPASV